MANFVRMAVVYGFHNLQERLPGALLREVAGVDDSVKQFSTIAKLHDKVDVSVILIRFKSLIMFG